MHTKEPWEYSEDIVYLGREGGFYLGDAPNPKDNARRIVACVNACAGIETEIIERNGGNVWKLLQQRDELLAALKLCLDTDCGEITEEAKKVAKSAIAKADLKQ